MSTRLLVCLVTIVASLSILRVFLANWLVESSETMRDLDQKINEQKTQNDKLAETLREKQSITFLEDKAKAAGFIPVPKLSFILPEPHVAFKL